MQILSLTLTTLIRGGSRVSPLMQMTKSYISAADYINFDPIIRSLINEHKIDWRQKSREDFINAILNENNIAQEISDDNNNNDEEVDEIEDKTLSFTESLKMLDKINKCSLLDEKSHKMLSTVTKKFENLQLQNKKQKS